MLVEVLHADLIDLDWSVLPVVDLCMVCFTLSSMSTIDCFIDMANKVKVNGHFLIADIHPARTNHSPFYDFNISGGHKIALKPCPVYPDKLIERLLPKNFILRNQKTIYDGKGEEYAFISVLERIE